MTTEMNSLSEMARIRQKEGINVIFDQDSQSSITSLRPRSRSRSSHDSCSSGSSRRRHVRRSYRGRHRSSSSSTSSSSSSRSFRSRSRSHPRCHRASSRCRCGGHRQYGQRHLHRRSPPRRFRAQSRSCSRSPSPNRSSSYRSYRSRSRSESQGKVNSLYMGQHGVRFSPSKPYRSRSRSSGHSVFSLNVDGKRELLQTVKSNPTKAFGSEQMDLPESVKPALEEQLVESSLTKPDTRVRPSPVGEKSPSQQEKDSESDEDVPSPKMSPKRKSISFSIHNSVAKPTVVPPNIAKVTPRVDSYESRKPYGHWVPVRKTAHLSRKHTVTSR